MKIKILDARGKFSATSFGKIFLLLFCVVIIVGAFIVSRLVITDNSQKKADEATEKQIELEQARIEGRTFDRFVDICYAQSPITEYNTFYVGEDETPIYIGHDTVQDVLDRTGYSIEWKNSYYYYNDYLYYPFEEFTADSILDSTTYDTLIGNRIDLSSSGRIKLVAPDGSSGLYIRFESLEDATASELNFKTCYVTEVSIETHYDNNLIKFRYLGLDNNSDVSAIQLFFNDDCDYEHNVDEESSYVSDSCSYRPDNYSRLYYYSHHTIGEDTYSTEFSVNTYVYCNMRWSEYLEAAKQN